jgi:hypothetical protein
MDQINQCKRQLGNVLDDGGRVKMNARTRKDGVDFRRRE